MSMIAIFKQFCHPEERETSAESNIHVRALQFRPPETYTWEFAPKLLRNYKFFVGFVYWFLEFFKNFFVI